MWRRRQAACRQAPEQYALRPEGEKAVPQTGQDRTVTPSLRGEGPMCCSGMPGSVTPSLRGEGSVATALCLSCAQHRGALCARGGLGQGLVLSHEPG
jgi:hypothetical protein